ncbi:FAD-dependent oxidoreductase [Streptomyces natalensis]|uniref:Flavin-dependent monooxygenase n=1 Tax=Streptomyces natalensis ATCC 27448 TaxID=1240678 RepID=A0A0D7CM20_9ACTN|nr:NAD(P)/FAD-dependent oxidoreductase [Streptomyces natalensis]KIZ17136.1 FAD-dependent oxidoreductase [Streptomyces natalensis ATCC 27448]
MTTTPRIAIIGAGPGGLLCARALQRHGIPVTVFDRDAYAEDRPQGGTLDLHEDTGQVALRAAGLDRECAAVARPEGQEMRLLDHTGALLFRHRPEAGEESRPEIDRVQLRRLLLDALAPGTVRWGRYLRTLHPLGGGPHRAEFDDGPDDTFDLVIGADGAWSRVRPLLSDDTPHYCGVTFVETGIDDADSRHPDVARLVGDGSMMAAYDNKALLARRTGRGRIRVYAAFRGSQDWALEQGVDLADPEAVRAALLRRFSGWDDRLLALLRDTGAGFVNRPLYALPVPHTWTHTPGLTLLGDAAHLMPPFSARGANLALLDGCDLAESLARHADADEAVRAYEAVMLPRAAAAAEGAARGLDAALAADAPRGTLRHLARRH